MPWIQWCSLDASLNSLIATVRKHFSEIGCDFRPLIFTEIINNKLIIVFLLGKLFIFNSAINDVINVQPALSGNPWLCLTANLPGSCRLYKNGGAYSHD